MNEPSRYAVADPRLIAAEAPYTFFLPMQAELAAIRRGDLVKLTFESLRPEDHGNAERMWVAISDAGPEELTGTLENEPSDLPVARGEVVRFRRHHVLDIVWGDPGRAPPRSAERREYWDRCLIDDCVLDGSEPVGFLYREVPDMQSEGDRYPDSGWRIRGRQGSASDEEMAARKVQYVALGAVLNKDDSWLLLLDAPVGSAFLRDFTTGEYVAER